MKRNLSTVLADMLGTIPPAERGLRAKLESIASSLWYTPPEHEQLQWRRVADVVQERFEECPPEADWERLLIDIWMGRKGAADCAACAGSGVIEGEMPCDCPSGDTAWFNDAELGRVRGAELKKKRL